MPQLSVDNETKAWRDRCPLKLWMQGRGKRWTIQMIADRCIRKDGKAMSREGVHAWLHGRSVPRTRAMHTLRLITGITLDAWLRWYEAKPVAGGGECDSTSTGTKTAASGKS